MLCIPKVLLNPKQYPIFVSVTDITAVEIATKFMNTSSNALTEAVFYILSLFLKQLVLKKVKF